MPACLAIPAEISKLPSSPVSKGDLSAFKMRRQIKAWLEADNSKPKSIEPSKNGLSDEAPASLPRKPERMKVRAHRKVSKEFTELYMKQDIKAHMGAITTMKFSLDGCLLASAGKDCAIHVWEIIDQSVSGEMERSDSSGKASCSPRASLDDGRHPDIHTCSTKRNASGAGMGLPPSSFRLRENALRSFHGHKEDVLDLSWSYSQFLLSSSKDKTVRLWHVSSGDCLRTFTHNDYVTCIQFNPVDDRYFISGSLDDKVRIWSIPDYGVVDWTDIRSMVTAACYTPDGKGVFIGSYKGTCQYYQTSGNKLQFQHQFEVCDTKKKKGYGKKVCGVQCMPGDASKVLVTSNDSRVRLFDGTELCCKYRGIRNANGHISASFSADGHYIICASEDSRVYIWNAPSAESSLANLNRRDADQPCEEYVSRDVCLAIPWPGLCNHTIRGVSPVPSQTDVSGGEEQTSKRAHRAASPWLGPVHTTADVQPGCMSKQLFRSRGRQRLHPAAPNEVGDQRDCGSREIWNLEQRDSIPPAAGKYADVLNPDLGEYEDNSPSSGEDGVFRHGTHDDCLKCSGQVRSPKKVVGTDSVGSSTHRPSPDSNSDLSLHSASQVTSPIEPYRTFQTSSIANSSSQNSFSSREDYGSVALPSQVPNLEVKPTQPSTTTNNNNSSVKLSLIAADGSGSPQLSSNSSSVDLTGSAPIVKLSSVSPSCGLVIVTAGLGGEIRTFQNYCHTDVV